MSFWESLFLFLKETLPGLILSFTAGKKVGEEGKEEIENELKEAQLELQIHKNHESVERDNAGRSDVSIVGDILSSGDSQSGKD